MGTFKNIVVATDFSENSNKAFDEAARLGQGGKLGVIHVVATSHAYDAETMTDKSASHVAKVYGDKARARIQELYGGKGEVEVAIDYGNEAEKIINFAKARDADLIVMGARGIGFVQGLLGGGSVAEKVVKNSSIPVLVVPT